MHDIAILFEDDHFLVVDKPAGIPTHSPDGKSMGLVERLEAQRGERLGVHQRLDASTSGVVAFSRSPQGATRLAKAFELRTVRKTYRALVCGSPATPAGEWNHTLLHQDGVTVEHPRGKPARSRYRTVAKIGPFTLLELDLLTGVTHQLRAQCALAGCPILGDSLYGGGDMAPRLCLHAQRLLITSEPNLPAFWAPTPFLLDKPPLAAIFKALCEGAKQRHGEFGQDEAIRLMAPQHSGLPEIVVEKIGKVLLVRHLEPETTSRWDVPAMQVFFKTAKREFACQEASLRIHESPSRNHACRALQKAFADVPAPFEAQENGIRYHFDLGGNATGLYLDQRENRAWIAAHAHGRVLNLFAYTCAFSLCAAHNPDTTSTLSVDSAPAALKRGRANFELNHIELDGHRFIVEDAMKYLAKCIQNGTTFDTVICDPPSFGRSGKTVFSLEDEYPRLLEMCVHVTAPGAVLLFSINHRKIRLTKLRAAWKDALRKTQRTPQNVDIFVNDDAPSDLLSVGTDLKTIRACF